MCVLGGGSPNHVGCVSMCVRVCNVGFGTGRA